MLLFNFRQVLPSVLLVDIQIHLMLLFNFPITTPAADPFDSNTSHVIIQSAWNNNCCRINKFKYISCYYSMCVYSRAWWYTIIQIHLMLLFNVIVETIQQHIINSNTSHVIIQ